MMKRISALFLVVAIMLTVLSACGGSSGTGKDGSVEFTYWLAGASADGSEYYTDYNENPVLQYILNNKTFKNSQGEDVKISFKFEMPVSGKEVDTYNTLISTDSCLDIMDMSYGMPIEEMYEAGQVIDLTEYVNEYMPNYKAFIDENNLEVYATKEIDGERKYLSITGAATQLDTYSQFCGFCYRRDLLVKYGTQPEKTWELDANNNKVYTDNPNAGKAFSYYYSLDVNGNEINVTQMAEDVDAESWVDDVIFPSGGPDPIYISDWEWMMEIFQKAQAEEGIDDGYVMSLYYPGFIQTGDLSCGFGGGGPSWYMNKDTGYCSFGAAEEGFKAYLECMNTWYKNNWIDKTFQDKNDLFFQIDEAKVYQGKVAMWLGGSSNLGARIRSDNQPLTTNAMVYGAAQPINDVYGTSEAKFVEPYVMYQNDGLLGGGICVTNKAKNKDIAVLCSFVDYLYSEEGSMLRTFGLNKEQYEASPNDFYKNAGMENGAYSISTDGSIVVNEAMTNSGSGFQNLMSLGRIIGLQVAGNIDYGYTPTYVNSREQWVKYKSTGFFGGAFNSQMPKDDVTEMEKVRKAIEGEYMNIEVPKFITGEKNLTSDYDSFVANLEKRKYKEVIEIYNKTIDFINSSK